jgi:hypothetical protein
MQRRGSWSELLPELLSMICHRVCPTDVPRFRAVSKHWRNSCELTVFPADLTPILVSDTITDTGLLRCYSPYFHKLFMVRTPLKPPAQSRIFSVDANGWALLRGPERAVSLCSLLDGSTFDTTESEFDEGYFCSTGGGGEDATTTSTAAGDRPELRGVVGMYGATSGAKFQSWGDGGGESSSSSSQFFEGGQTSEFTMVHCKPVLHKGLWFCMGNGGRLGVFDPVNSEWSVLDKPDGFGSTELEYKNCYLVGGGAREELLVVLTGVNGTPVNVMRLDEEEMEWEKVESLGGRAIFTGAVSSRSMDKPPGAMANKVYLPKFYGCPEVVEAELTIAGGRLGFVPVPRRVERRGSNASTSVDDMVLFKDGGNGAGDDGAWCYDLELDSGVDKQIVGCKSLMQYIWVDLARASP